MPEIGSAGGGVTVPVLAENIPGVGAITIKIDVGDGLTFTGVNNISDKLSGSFTNFNNNTFLLSWENFSGENFESDTLFLLTFQFSGFESSLIFLPGNEVADTAGNILNVQFDNGKVVSTTGFNSNEVNTGIAFYPNPVNRVLSVQGNQFSRGKIRIYSITGEEVFSTDISGNMNTMRFDLSTLSNGVYLFAYMPSGKNNIHGSFSGKFLVAK